MVQACGYIQIVTRFAMMLPMLQPLTKKITKAASILGNSESTLTKNHIMETSKFWNHQLSQRSKSQRQRDQSWVRNQWLVNSLSNALMKLVLSQNLHQFQFVTVTTELKDILESIVVNLETNLRCSTYTILDQVVLLELIFSFDLKVSTMDPKHLKSGLIPKSHLQVVKTLSMEKLKSSENTVQTCSTSQFHLRWSRHMKRNHK